MISKSHTKEVKPETSSIWQSTAGNEAGRHLACGRYDGVIDTSLTTVCKSLGNHLGWGRYDGLIDNI